MAGVNNIKKDGSKVEAGVYNIKKDGWLQVFMILKRMDDGRCV